MKKFVMPFLLMIVFIAAIHFVLLCIEFIFNPDYQIWNFFNMNQLSRWFPILNSGIGFISSFIFFILSYTIFYILYKKGYFKKYLK